MASYTSKTFTHNQLDAAVNTGTLSTISPAGALAVAWRHVLGFLQSSPEASLSLEALFDDSGKLSLVNLSHAMAQLGANLNEAQLLAFQRDADVNGDGEV